MKKQAAIDWPLVLQLFTGGALTGAGLGAGTSFLRHLKSLQDQAKRDTSFDDDVLYLNLPAQPEVAGRRKKATTSTFAAGGLSGIVGTILAYNAVRNMYQKSRKRQLQRELDQAQEIYLGDLTQMGSLSKQASQFGALTTGVGSLYLALFLAALGSGVVANKIMKKQFPPVQHPNRGKPRKIVIRTQQPQGHAERTLVSEKHVTPDALEGLVRTDLNFPKVSSADGSLADLVAAVASGRGEEFKSNLEQFGLDAALDLVKGARHEKTSGFHRNLALTWVCTDPLVATAVAPLAAAEFQEGGGEWFMKAAADIEAQYHDALAGLLEDATRDARTDAYRPLLGTRQVKQAMDLGSGLLEQALLSQSLGSILTGSDDPNKLPGGQDTHRSEDSTPADVEIKDDEAKQFWEKYGPEIDSVLARV